MNNTENFDFTKLRTLRKLADITLEEVIKDTGLSLGYISRIERGQVKNIANVDKRKTLIKYIKKLEKKIKDKSGMRYAKEILAEAE